MLQKIAIRKNVVENYQSVSGIAIFLKNTIVIKKMPVRAVSAKNINNT